MPAMIRFPLLACALALSAAGCMTATNAAVDKIIDGQTFAMQPGQQVALPDRSRLHYVGVQSDSRCPPDVQCIQAGNALVGFKWQPGGDEALSFALSTPEPPQSRDLGSLRLTLLSLAFGAAPKVQLRIEHAQ